MTGAAARVCGRCGSECVTGEAAVVWLQTVCGDVTRYLRLITCVAGRYQVDESVGCQVSRAGLGRAVVGNVK